MNAEDFESPNLSLFPRDALKGSFWLDALHWNMPAFLDEFTVHDSALQGIILDDQLVPIVLIQWDIFWNQAIPDGYDRLMIRFPNLYSCKTIQGSIRHNVLGGATSIRLSDRERANLLENRDFDLAAYQSPPDDILHPAFEETLTLTTFDVMNFARIEVLHGASVNFAVANEHEGLLALREIVRAINNPDDTK